MPESAVFQEFIRSLRKKGLPNIRAPHGEGIHWDVVDNSFIRCILPIPLLEKNFQENHPSAPSFALAFTFWSNHFELGIKSCRISIVGQQSDNRDSRLHLRRNLFIINQYCELLGDIFTVERSEDLTWRWPNDPVLNQPGKSDRAGNEHGNPEHLIEVQLATNRNNIASVFPCKELLTQWGRQLPLGLFDHEVATINEWTPGKGSQIDLWSKDIKGETLHLFELKADNNAHVGIIPQALYYARLMHYVRTGLPNGGAIRGGGDGIEAARKARQIVMWLIAPNYHPLVYSGGVTPLALLNEALKSQGLEFRIMPFELKDGLIARWLPEAQWPRPAH